MVAVFEEDMKIRRFIQEQLFAGPSFQIPKGYFFVRKNVNSFTSEYWVWPLHWVARVWYGCEKRVYYIIGWFLSNGLDYGKKKTKAQ